MTLEDAVDVLNAHRHGDRDDWHVAWWMVIDGREALWAFNEILDRGLYPFEAVAVAEKYLRREEEASR